jgi:hypothetical protein
MIQKIIKLFYKSTLYDLIQYLINIYELQTKFYVEIINLLLKYL